MSTGPPTPPPSSATEIQDAARTIVPPVPAASTSAPAPAPQARQDNFTQIFPQIASLASEKNYLDLIKFVERNDIASDSERQPSRLLLTAPLVLAYLIVDDLPPARFALNRLPNNLATSPLGKQLHSLLASTSERKYANVYSRTQTLLEHVGQPDFFDTSLGALLGIMIGAFLDSFRSRTFNLLQKAYTSLSLSLAEMYLGLPTNEVLAAAQGSGWTFDPSTQVLTPAPKSNVRPTSNGFARQYPPPSPIILPYDLSLHHSLFLSRNV
ncbi:CSN8-PSD8-EIF3K domain-containing protein [Mycena venus]|uniref:CSN8-PSD8-EIF3K domain-containing protein n=1 Tax=Mycena venus TaxID=2733690 RepID=A0A8H7CIY0_9AGAR|nr:CSN8-PSD8-EIF3K domain-containing protein [Mycena venus]